MRKDTGVVSDRYRYVTYRAILDTVQKAIASLDIGLLPRGMYQEGIIQASNRLIWNIED